MHVYGVGMNGKIGSGVHELLTKKYNPERGRREGRSLEEKVVPATINAEVLKARLTMESNRVSKIERPFITVDSEVLDVWGDVGSGVDHVSFLPNNRPALTYEYPLNDDEIKGLVDAGMYRNPQFEALLNTLMKSEQFEITKDVTAQSMESEHDDNIVPMVIVHDVGRIKQEIQANSDNEIAYTSFSSVIERTVDMALQLEAEGMSVDDLNKDDDIDLDREITVEMDKVFDDALVGQDVYVGDELEDEDVAVDITDSLAMDDVFGQTSEEQRIQQLKEATTRGEDWETGEAIDPDVLRERERREQEEDDYEQDTIELVDPADMQLTDVEEYPINVSRNQEPEEEDDLEL